MEMEWEKQTSKTNMYQIPFLKKVGSISNMKKNFLPIHPIKNVPCKGGF